MSTIQIEILKRDIRGLRHCKINKTPCDGILYAFRNNCPEAIYSKAEIDAKILEIGWYQPIDQIVSEENPLPSDIPVGYRFGYVDDEGQFHISEKIGVDEEGNDIYFDYIAAEGSNVTNKEDGQVYGVRDGKLVDWEQYYHGDYVEYDENGNIPLREGTEILGTLPNGEQHNGLSLKTYNAGTPEEFSQWEAGSESIHWNTSGPDRPTHDLPDGTKKDYAFLDDITGGGGGTADVSIQNITLLASSWNSDKKQIVTLAKAIKGDNVDLGLPMPTTEDNMLAFGNALIACTAIIDSTHLEFTCVNIPTVDIYITIRNIVAADISNKQNRVIDCICDTPAATVNKIITIPDYELTIGDEFSVTFTLGNTAVLALSINGSDPVPVSLGGGTPTAASGTGGAFVAPNRPCMYRYNGTYMVQFGSNDSTDDDTTNITNLYGSVSYQFVKAKNLSIISTTYPFIGLSEDGYIYPIVKSNSNDNSQKPFIEYKIALYENIMFSAQVGFVWDGSASISNLFSRYNIGSSNWRFQIGQYYNKSGVLKGNDVITDLVQTPMYIGGTLDGEYFVPSEFSLTLRDPNLVYKRFAYFAIVGNIYLTDYQPVYVHNGTEWVTWTPTYNMIGDINAALTAINGE